MNHYQVVIIQNSIQYNEFSLHLSIERKMNFIDLILIRLYDLKILELYF